MSLQMRNASAQVDVMLLQAQKEITGQTDKYLVSLTNIFFQ